MVDMDAVAQSLWSKNNDAQIANTIAQQVGMMTSAWEHRIPEMLFTNEEHPGEAVSAVKALGIASNEGQRIYQIQKENVNAVLPVLNISTEVKNEIRASVAVGKVATVSQNNITVGSWTGVGYIIADPDTGAGAYRISGGSNGGGMFSLISVFIAGIAGVYDGADTASKADWMRTVKMYKLAAQNARMLTLFGIFVSAVSIFLDKQLTPEQKAIQFSMTVLFALLDFFASRSIVATLIGPVPLGAGAILLPIVFGVLFSVLLAMLLPPLLEMLIEIQSVRRSLRFKGTATHELV